MRKTHHSSPLGTLKTWKGKNKKIKIKIRKDKVPCRAVILNFLKNIRQFKNAKPGSSNDFCELRCS